MPSTGTHEAPVTSLQPTALIENQISKPSVRLGRSCFWRWVDRSLDGLLPLVFSLQLFSAQELLATGLLMIWLALRLTSQAVHQRGSGSPWAIFLLGLLLVNVRVIVLREESSPSGPSDLLLVVLGLAAGAERAPLAWRASLQWLGLGSVALAVLLPMFWPGTINPSLNFEAVLTQQPLAVGGLNRFGTLVMLLTLCAAYGGLLEQRRWKRLSLLGAAALGYAVCLRTDSRLAALGPPLAMGLAYLITRLLGRLGWRRTLLASLGCGAAIGTLMGFWWFVAGSGSQLNWFSDMGRLQAARCWASIILSGHNRFLWGIGYGDRSRQFCAEATALARGHSWNPMGHAHNTVAQILGDTGTLGLLAFCLVAVLLALALGRRLQALEPEVPWGWQGFSMTEAGLALNLLLLFNVLTTTVHLINPATQCLIGYLAATALWTVANGSGRRPALADQSPPAGADAG